jgi:hypothetical protein
MKGTELEIGKELLTKTAIKIVTGLIAGFMIISSLWWFAATSMMLSGKIGIFQMLPGGMHGSSRNLGLGEHIIRISQVALVIVAAFTLIRESRKAPVLLIICLFISLVLLFFVQNWTVNFIGWPFWSGFLLFAYGFAYLLKRRGLVR